MAFRGSMLAAVFKSYNKLSSQGTSNIFHQLKPFSPSSRTYSSSIFSRFQPGICSGITNKLRTEEPKQEYHILSKIPSTVFTRTQFQTKPLEVVEGNRSVTKFSLRKGRRKTVKTVIRRFFRLDWGIWIRPRTGRSKKLWTKGKLRRKRLRQHVFCNAWHTKTLDRMTTKYWHKKKYFVDDPYENYHTRQNFPITKDTKNIKHQLV